MAELATVARPYAEALFRVAQAGKESSNLAAWSELVSELAQIGSHPEVQAYARNPKVSESDVAATILFHTLKNGLEGAADAEITSAFDLSEGQTAELVATLEKKFSRKLNPAVTVDPSLLGGVRVVVGDQVLDTSVRAKLQQLHAALVS